MHFSPVTERVFRHAHMACGIGSGARGFNGAQPRVGHLRARFECAGGIDVDPGAIRNFERLTGVKGTVTDLFNREQYRAFHGRDPGPDWREAIPADVRAVFSHVDVCLASYPCKGFSSLLSQAVSLTAKYQALNALTLRGMWLTLEAYKDDPIPILLFENVPRIATRGRWLLDQIIALLHAYGYSVNEDVHDCGLIGNLAQSRKRFLLIARHPDKVPPFIYQPRLYPLRGVGEVIGELPLPGDPRAGSMHRVPALQWKTWVRLAFVEAGSDWRSLNRLRVENGVLADYGIVPEPDMRENAYGVCRWEDRGPLVTSARAPGQGRFSVADPRPFTTREGSGFLGVNNWIGHVGTISSRGGPTNGSYAIADPRPGYGPATHTNLLSVTSFDQSTRVVSGAVHVAGGALSVADPRYGEKRDCTLGVLSWSMPTGVVQGKSGPTNGTFSIADPRPAYGPDTHRHVLGVHAWSAASGVVTGNPKPTGGAHCVADPRIDGHPSSVQCGVREWARPAGVVTGNMWVGSGPNAIADPRIEGKPRFNNTFRIVPFDGASAAVAGPGGPGGGLAVADPRAPEGRHVNGKYRVTGYRSAANAVIGASTTGMGAFVVADPKYAGVSPGAHANKMRVVSAAAACPTVTGSDRVGSGALSVADPRPTCLMRADRDKYLTQGHYGVVGWSGSTGAVPASAKDNSGPWSIADPREPILDEAPVALPNPDDRLVARIVAMDQTWHRPFTTLELAALQAIVSARDFFDLLGGSDAQRREWIGNAIPADFARGMAETIGETLLLAGTGKTFTLSARDIWVKPGALALTIDSRQPAFEMDGFDTSTLAGTLQ
jgi:site-specific DNA-cytosine methylase